MAPPDPLTAMASPLAPSSGTDCEFISSALRRVALLHQVFRTSTSKYRSINEIVYQHEADPLQDAPSAHEMKRLGIERLAIATEVERVEQNVKSHIEEGVKLECRFFLERMHATLPRELRDMVYGFMIGEEPATVRETDAHGSAMRPLHDLKLESPFSRALKARGYDNLLGDSTTAGDSLRELAELWYKTSVFCFRNPFALQVLAPYFKNTGNLPPHVLEERFDLYQAPCRLIKAVKITKWIWDVRSMNNQFQSLAENLQLIHTLEACTSVDFILVSRGYDMMFSKRQGRAAALAQEFQIVFPVIGALITAGYKFTVCLSHILELEVTLGHLSVEYWAQKFQKLADQDRLAV